jgi:hypothetical protein
MPAMLARGQPAEPDGLLQVSLPHAWQEIRKKVDISNPFDACVQ